MDIDGGNPKQLMNEKDAFAFRPHCSPDGKWVVFRWLKSGFGNLCSQAADGSQPMERLTTSDYLQVPASFSPDGGKLAFVEFHPDTDLDIFLLDMGSHRVTPFLNSRAMEWYPEFSPDGRWIAYASDESGRFQVYLRPFPGPGAKWQISVEGGDEPLWERNERQLFYRWGDQFWVVDVRTDGGFSPSKPRLLFKAPGFGGGTPVRGWDISLDGQRFLIVKQEERKPQSVTELILVQNWFEELKRLAPTGKK
jgi:serine/threonine-protein kinase